MNIIWGCVVAGHEVGVGVEPQAVEAEGADGVLGGGSPVGGCLPRKK